jgi:hypothetical protein
MTAFNFAIITENMFDFLKKKKPGSDIIIEVTGDMLTINGQVAQFPTTLAQLEEHFGPVEKQEQGQYRWADLGILTHPSITQEIEHLTIRTGYSTNKEGAAIEQGPYFTGKIIVDGVEIQNTVFPPFEQRTYYIDCFANKAEAKPHTISIEYDATYDPEYKKPPVQTKESYTIKELDEEIIAFYDFGFKLAVIQELMYVQKVLEPTFDVREFARHYQGRIIDIETEGYNPIPEVTQYFRDLPVPKRLAPLVTRLLVDGGNEIYANLLVYGDGDEDYWDIASVADIVQFPNLKEAEIVYIKDGLIEELIAHGIDARRR